MDTLQEMVLANIRAEIGKCVQFTALNRAQGNDRIANRWENYRVQYEKLAIRAYRGENVRFVVTFDSIGWHGGYATTREIVPFAEEIGAILFAVKETSNDMENFRCAYVTDLATGKETHNFLRDAENEENPRGVYRVWISEEGDTLFALVTDVCRASRGNLKEGYYQEGETYYPGGNNG